MTGLICRWHCLDCDATGTTDKEAEKHGRDQKHSTVSHQTPTRPERRPR